MRSLAKTLIVSAIALLLTASAQAQTPTTITSLTCQGANRYNINNAAVYAYSFSSTATNPAYFTAYLSGAMLETMLLNQYLNNTAYSSCYFANNNGVQALTVTIMGVTSIGVGANVDAGALSQDSTKQLFTEVDFAYTNLSFGPNTNVKKEPVGTPEEQAKAFQAYKAQGLSLPRR